MVRRRQFLIATGSTIGGVIVLPTAAWSAWQSSALPAAWPPANLAQNKGKVVSPEEPEDPDTGDSSSAPAPRTLLIYDPAFALACSVATHARRNGGFALALEGDAGALWYRSILPFLQRGTPVPQRDGAGRGTRLGSDFSTDLGSGSGSGSGSGLGSGLGLGSAPDSNLAQRSVGVQGPNDPNSVEPRIAITGLTPHAAFFVLSTLATVAGMRILSNRSAGDRHLVAWHLEFPLDTTPGRPELMHETSPRHT
jgi:hypothetical protein